MHEQSFCFCSKKKAVVRQIHLRPLSLISRHLALTSPASFPPSLEGALWRPRSQDRPKNSHHTHSNIHRGVPVRINHICLNCTCAKPRMSGTVVQTTASTMESIGHHGLPGLIRADHGRGPDLEYELTGCSDQLPSQFQLI